MTIASGTGRPPRVTRPSTRKPCSKTISAVASAWPGPIVTVDEAEREPARKSPAFARRVTTPSGTPVSSNEPPAAVRVGGEEVLALGADVDAGELRVRQPGHDPPDERALREGELDLLGVVARHHGLGRGARLVAQRGPERVAAGSQAARSGSARPRR